MDVPAPIEMEWADIREPGAYLHLASGLLLRVYDEELQAVPRSRSGLIGRLARLSASPHMPVTALREIATRHGYRVTF